MAKRDNRKSRRAGLVSGTRIATGRLREVVKILRAGGRPMVVESDAMDRLETEVAGFTRLTAGERDLTGWSHQKMQEISFYLYRKNHMARRLITIIQDFVVGDGIQAVSKNEAIQEVIDDFWNDPHNAMDRLNGDRVRDWQVFGEIVIPVTRAANGMIRIGWIDPAYIEDVIPSFETGQPDKIRLTRAGADLNGGKGDLKVITFDDKTERLAGDCFYGRINCASGARRGVGELYTAADWIDGLEEMMFSQIDRSRLLNSFLWDITMSGADQTTIDAFQKKWNANPPEPASSFVHNDKITMQAVSPQLGAYELSRQAKDVKDYILGGMGIPSPWFGSGDDANLATARAMGEPSRKMLKRKQKEFQNVLWDIVQYAIQERFHSEGGIPGVSEEDLSDFDIVIPDFSGPDISAVGQGIAAMIASVDQAVDGGYISSGTGRQLVAMAFSAAGADIDPESELAAIDEEKIAKTDSAAAGADDANRQAVADAEKMAALQAAAARMRSRPLDLTGED